MSSSEERLALRRQKLAELRAAAQKKEQQTIKEAVTPKKDSPSSDKPDSATEPTPEPTPKQEGADTKKTSETPPLVRRKRKLEALRKAKREKEKPSPSTTPIKSKPDTDDIKSNEVIDADQWKTIAEERAKQITNLQQQLNQAHHQSSEEVDKLIRTRSDSKIPNDKPDTPQDTNEQHKVTSLQKQLEYALDTLDSIRKLVTGPGSQDTPMEEIIESVKLQQEEIEYHEYLYKTTCAELENAQEEIRRMHTKLASTSDSKQTMNEYETAYQEQSDELQQLKAQFMETSKDLTKYQRKSEVSTSRATELEKNLDRTQKELVEAQRELEATKKQLTGVQDLATDAKKRAQITGDQVEELHTKIDNLEDAKEHAEKELEQVLVEAKQHEQELLQEIEMHESSAATRNMELDQLQDKMAAEVEALHIEIDESRVEIRQAKLEATQAKEETAKVEEQLNAAITNMKEELLASSQKMEGAAVVGLGLTELIDTLKNEHAERVAELEKQAEDLGAERDHALAQFEERNKMLTDVMEFLKKQNTSAGGDEGDDLEEGLQGLLDRSAREKEELEATLQEYEDEANRLTTEVSALTKQRLDLQEANRKLTKELETCSSERDSLQENLDEKTEMLTKVMNFVKDQGGKGFMDDDYEDEDEQNTSPLERLTNQLTSLTEERQRLLETVRARDAEIARLKTLLSQRETQIQEQSDEIEGLNARVEELAQSTQLAEDLSVMLREGEDKRKKLLSERDTLQEERDAMAAELQEIREQLATMSENLQTAAQGGLSLMDMINKLKSDHETEVNKLEARIEDLERELEDYKTRLAGLLDFLPPGAEDSESDVGDALEILKRRLEQAQRDKQSLEDTLAEYEHDQALANAEIKKLREQIESLDSKIKDLTAQLEAAETELERFREGVGKALKTAADARKSRGYDSDEDEDENKDPIQELLATLDEALLRLDETEKALAEAKEEIKTLTSNLEDANNTIEDLREEIDSVNAMREKADAEHKRVAGELRKLIDALKKENENKETVISNLKAEIDRLKKKLQDSQTTNKEDKERIHDLELELHKSKQRLEQLEKKLEKTIAWIRKQALRKWVPDNEVAECPLCDDEFSLMKRRHHCRICGGVYCRNCTSQKQLTTAKKKPVRACTDCHNFLMELESGNLNASPMIERRVITESPPRRTRQASDVSSATSATTERSRKLSEFEDSRPRKESSSSATTIKPNTTSNTSTKKDTVALKSTSKEDKNDKESTKEAKQLKNKKTESTGQTTGGPRMPRGSAPRPPPSPGKQKPEGEPKVNEDSETSQDTTDHPQTPKVADGNKKEINKELKNGDSETSQSNKSSPKSDLKPDLEKMPKGTQPSLFDDDSD
eukprot:m.87509 g.87509  ORF g.87509 m.87509 type:complete len:1363 (-) comp13112_c0_seq1:1188-5276(-)